MQSDVAANQLWHVSSRKLLNCGWHQFHSDGAGASGWKKEFMFDCVWFHLQIVFDQMWATKLAIMWSASIAIAHWQSSSMWLVLTKQFQTWNQKWWKWHHLCDSTFTFKILDYLPKWQSWSMWQAKLPGKCEAVILLKSNAKSQKNIKCQSWTLNIVLHWIFLERNVSWDVSQVVTSVVWITHFKHTGFCSIPLLTVSQSSRFGWIMTFHLKHHFQGLSNNKFQNPDHSLVVWQRQTPNSGCCTQPNEHPLFWNSDVWVATLCASSCEFTLKSLSEHGWECHCVEQHLFCDDMLFGDQCCCLSLPLLWCNNAMKQHAWITKHSLLSNSMGTTRTTGTVPRMRSSIINLIIQVRREYEAPLAREG